MVTFLAIQEVHDMEPILTVTQQGQRRFVPGEPVQSTAIVARPVDVQQLATDAMTSNNNMVMAVLRQMQPTIDADPADRAQPAGLSSPGELAARNERFRWTVVATVILSMVATGGIVAIAVVTGQLTPALGLATWIALTGLCAMVAVWHVHRTELAHTPEALERLRTECEFDVSAQDAESRQILAQAYADAVRDDAAARRASAESARQANIAYTQAPAQRQMDYTPRTAPDCSTAPAPVCAPVTPTAPATPDPALAAMLAFIREVFTDCERRDSSLITQRLPWSARGDWQAGDKARAVAVLATFPESAPLIETRDGNRAHLNRQWHRRVAELHISREWR